MGYAQEVWKLQLKFEAKQKPLLDERKHVLTKTETGSTVQATPALPGFWKTALKNHPVFEEEIHEWDEPVLDFLQDITKEHLKEDDANAGFKLVFHFTENPYFSNDTLWKEYHSC